MFLHVDNEDYDADVLTDLRLRWAKMSDGIITKTCLYIFDLP